MQILPNGPLPSLQAAGQLQTALGGAITTTRASNKYCTNSSGTLVLLSSNVPCVDSNGASAEASATNLALQSNNFTAGAWSATNLAASQNATSPDGTADAWTLTDNSTNGNHYLIQAIANSAGALTFSVYVALGTSTCFNIVDGTSGGFVVFNLSTGTVPSATGLTGTIVPAQYPGWYRASAYLASAAANDYFFLSLNPSCANFNLPSYAGTGKTAQVYGMQAEAGAFATSYIPTTSTAVTRAAETDRASGSFAIGNTPSYSADLTLQALTPGNATVVEITNTFPDRWNLMANNISGAVRCQYVGSGTSVDSPASLVVGVKAHVLCRYDGTKLWACVNGSCNSTTTAITPASTTFSTVALDGADASYIEGGVSNVCVAATPTGCT